MRMLVVLLVSAVFLVSASLNKGQEKIILDGGSAGGVPFPHHRHQNGLGDCDICHQLFPQEQGSIDRLKAAGRLANKQIMNKLCIKCHNSKKAVGESTGPVTCARCHLKEK